jgi:hypothetical protein
VIGDRMVQGRPRLPEVERTALIGNRVEQDPPALAEVGFDRAHRIVAMLEEVIGDDAINRLRLEGRRRRHHRRHPPVEIQTVELRIVRPQIQDRHSIHTAA